MNWNKNFKDTFERLRLRSREDAIIFVRKEVQSNLDDIDLLIDMARILNNFKEYLLSISIGLFFYVKDEDYDSNILCKIENIIAESLKGLIDNNAVKIPDLFNLTTCRNLESYLNMLLKTNRNQSDKTNKKELRIMINEALRYPQQKRIIEHLKKYDSAKYKEEYSVPEAVTLKGIATNLGMTEGNASNILRKLNEKDIVEPLKEKKHIKNNGKKHTHNSYCNRRVRAYFITNEGKKILNNT